MSDASTKNEFLGVRAITAEYPISHTTIWRQLQLGRFPASIRVGRKHLWRRADIEAYFTPSQKRA